MEKLSRSRWIQIAVIVIVLLVIVAALIAYFCRPVKMSSPPPPPVAIDTTNQPTEGNATAKVHIVAFEDLKCFNCKRYELNIFPKIKELYIDTNKASYSFINLAFIFGSMPAANAARCLYDQNPAYFFPFVHYVYSHQPPESEDWATIPALMDMASHIQGVDKDKLSQCLVTSPNMTLINNNLVMAVKIMNGKVETPSVYVNGMIARPLTLERIQELVRAAEKKSK